MTLPKIIRFSRTRGAPVEPLLRQRVLTRIVECHTHHGGSMPVPTVSFDLRGKTAGQAFLSKHHIRLNGQLLNENPDDFIHQTVGFNRWPRIYPNVFKYTQNEPAVHGLRYAKRCMNVDDARGLDLFQYQG